MTGIMKFLGSNHKRVKQCDQRLAWEKFQKIYHIYSYIKNKEEINADFLLTIMSYHRDINEVSETTVNSHENHQNEFTFQVIKIVPPGLHQSQPIATKVWNCDEIGLDPSGKWRKVVCTSKYFQGEITWKAQTG